MARLLMPVEGSAAAQRIEASQALSQLGGLGTQPMWGLSPSLDLLDVLGSNSVPQHPRVLLAGSSDYRMLLRTASRASRKGVKKITFYVYEPSLHTLARQLIFFVLLFTRAAPSPLVVDDLTYTVLEVLGNIRVREATAATITDIVNILYTTIQPPVGPRSSRPLLPSLHPFAVDSSQMLTKERDMLLDVLRTFARPTERLARGISSSIQSAAARVAASDAVSAEASGCGGRDSASSAAPMGAPGSGGLACVSRKVYVVATWSAWNARLRHRFGTKYTTRAGQIDWDYSMTLRDVVPILKSLEYKTFVSTGIAFDRGYVNPATSRFVQAVYNAPNRTLLHLSAVASERRWGGVKCDTDEGAGVCSETLAELSHTDGLGAVSAEDVAQSRGLRCVYAGDTRTSPYVAHGSVPVDGGGSDYKLQGDHSYRVGSAITAWHSLRADIYEWVCGAPWKATPHVFEWDVAASDASTHDMAWVVNRFGDTMGSSKACPKSAKARTTALSGAPPASGGGAAGREAGEEASGDVIEVPADVSTPPLSVEARILPSDVSASSTVGQPVIGGDGGKALQFEHNGVEVEVVALGPSYERAVKRLKVKGVGVDCAFFGTTASGLVGAFSDLMRIETTSGGIESGRETPDVRATGDLKYASLGSSTPRLPVGATATQNEEEDAPAESCGDRRAPRPVSLSSADACSSGIVDPPVVLPKRLPWESDSEYSKACEAALRKAKEATAGSSKSQQPSTRTRESDVRASREQSTVRTAPPWDVENGCGGRVGVVAQSSKRVPRDEFHLRRRCMVVVETAKCVLDIAAEQKNAYLCNVAREVQKIGGKVCTDGAQRAHSEAHVFWPLREIAVEAWAEEAAEARSTCAEGAALVKPTLTELNTAHLPSIAASDVGKAKRGAVSKAQRRSAILQTAPNVLVFELTA